MAIVNIKQACALTGKSRRTIQRHIGTGKLSKTTTGTGGQGIDTSELLRVYGAFVDDKTATMTQGKNKSVAHVVIGQDAQSVTTKVVPIGQHDAIVKSLKKEIELMQKLLDEKDKRNDDLKQSLLLLEHQSDKKRKKFLGIF